MKSPSTETVSGRASVPCSCSLSACSGDGYYLLHQVMPGQYTLRIAPEQADKLRLQGTLARPLTVPVDGDFINGQDFALRRAASDAAPAGEPKRP